MTLLREIEALRTATTWTAMEHVVALRLTGRDAFEVLDRVCGRDLFLRDGAVLQALLLQSDGTVWADAYIGCDDDAFVLLVEGPPADVLIAHLQAHSPAGAQFEIADLSGSHRQVAINGPWAWEAVASFAGSDIVSLPYLTLFKTTFGTCVRAGKTGEYGYHFICPETCYPELMQQLEALSGPMDMRPASLEALDHCALENWFFNIRREGSYGLTPLELQLRWRVSRRKADFVGASALEARRTQGITARVTTLVAPEAIAIGDTVLHGDLVIGSVLNAGYSPTRGDWVGLALVDLPWASVGIPAYHCRTRAGTVPVRTASPPLLNNRSLHLRLDQHRYGDRQRDAFPDIAPRGTPNGSA